MPSGGSPSTNLTSDDAWEWLPQGIAEVVIQTDVSTEEELKRALGAAVVWMMPAEGVDEALNDLADVFRFYTERLARPVYQAIEGPRLTGRTESPVRRPRLSISE